MRISEWSSDVCSSDLSEGLGKGDCQAVGGIQYYGDGRVQSDGGTWRPWFARAVSIGHGRKLSDPIDPDAIESSINYITGASMLVSRAFLQATGPMREDYFLYCEEVEWCLRARARSEEHTSELQSLMRISYAVFCLKKKKQIRNL